MRSFTLKVTEGAKALAETTVTVPELSYVPETAATHVRADGGRVPLLGWRGQLWAAMREPSEPSAPLTFERLAEIANGPPGKPSFGYEADAFENPFAPNRFLRPLDLDLTRRRTALRDARIAEVRAAAQGLAIVGGTLHRAVHEPVHVLRLGNAGLHVDVEFRDPASLVSGPTWGVFRADRGDDAAEFAAAVARDMGRPYLGPRGGLEVVYPQILRVDDVRLAFSEAFGRFANLARRPGAASAEAEEIDRDARILMAGADAFEDASAAEEAHALLERMADALPRLSQGRDDMMHSATSDALRLVSRRYADLDRPWLLDREAGPRFAP